MPPRSRRERSGCAPRSLARSSPGNGTTDPTALEPAGAWPEPGRTGRRLRSPESCSRKRRLSDHAEGDAGVRSRRPEMSAIPENRPIPDFLNGLPASDQPRSREARALPAAAICNEKPKVSVVLGGLDDCLPFLPRSSKASGGAFAGQVQNHSLCGQSGKTQARFPSTS